MAENGRFVSNCQTFLDTWNSQADPGKSALAAASAGRVRLGGYQVRHGLEAVSSAMKPASKASIGKARVCSRR